MMMIEFFLYIIQLYRRARTIVQLCVFIYKLNCDKQRLKFKSYGLFLSLPESFYGA